MMLLITLLLDLYQQILAWLALPHVGLSFTDPAITYENPAVKTLWEMVLIVSDSSVAILIILTGYQVLYSGYSSRYSTALVLLPRLIFGCIGANYSLFFAQFWIDLNNALCAVLLTQGQPLFFFPVSVNIATDSTFLLLEIILAIFFLLLSIQVIVRLILVILWLLCLPIAFILLTLPVTQRVGKTIIQSYIATIFVQTLQLLCLILGGKIIVPFFAIDPSGGPARFALGLADIALVWTCLQIPRMMRQLLPAEGADAASSLIKTALLRLIP